MWNAAAGGERYFMSGEDLTTQAGLAVQQDLALVNLLGLTHVERNGHHYVNGMAGLPQHEQDGFLAAHPDLYEHSRGAVRLKIRNGRLAIGSLAGAGFAAGADPDWAALTPLAVSPSPRHDGQRLTECGIDLRAYRPSEIAGDVGSASSRMTGESTITTICARKPTAATIRQASAPNSPPIKAPNPAPIGRAP